MIFIDSARVSGILGYLERKEAVQGALEVGTTHQVAPGPPGTPWWVVPPSGYPQAQPGPIVFLLAHKKSSWSFVAFGLRLILISYDVKNMVKTALGTMSIG